MSNAMQKLLDKVNKTKSQGFEDPHADKFWRMEADAAGNGFAVIRFLPGHTEDDDVFIKTMSHGFQNAAGKWFIDNCLTTIGQECPVCEENNTLWNSGVEANKDIVRKRKRKVSYISNIQVISDSRHPENEGKVFLFKYGQQIFDKIINALQPEFEDEKPLNPFDAETGANFKLKMRRKDGYANFESSAFEEASAINKKDLKDIMGKIYDLQVFLAPAEFKSYDDLKDKLYKVIGGPVNNKASKSREDVEDDDVPVKTERQQRKGAVETPADDDDDSISFFQKLAEED